MKPLYNRIVIAGAGSAFWLTVALCRELEDLVSIEVYDDDTFEGGGGAKRLPKPVDPSTYKVEYLKTFVRHVMGNTPPIVHTRRFYPDDLGEGDWSNTIFVDATDMGRSEREVMWDTVDMLDIKGIRLALDGTGIATVSPGPPIYMGDELEQHDDYTIKPWLGQVFRSVGMGAEAIKYLLYTGKVLERNDFVPTPFNETNEIRGNND